MALAEIPHTLNPSINWGRWHDDSGRKGKPFAGTHGYRGHRDQDVGASINWRIADCPECGRVGTQVVEWRGIHPACVRCVDWGHRPYLRTLGRKTPGKRKPKLAAAIQQGMRFEPSETLKVWTEEVLGADEPNLTTIDRVKLLDSRGWLGHQSRLIAAQWIDMQREHAPQ